MRQCPQDAPNPCTKTTAGAPIVYTFETWGQQLVDFCREVVGSPVLAIGNSVGCIVAMQAAVMAPEQITAVALLNCSLRLLHDRRRAEQPWLKRIGTPILQNLLAIPALGHGFFGLLAKPKTVRKILLQAYGNPAAVTDELVDLLMYPVISRQALKNWSIDQQYASGALPMLINSQMSSSVHAAADHQATIQGQSVYLPAARIYAHPTRLMSWWIC